MKRSTGARARWLNRIAAQGRNSSVTSRTALLRSKDDFCEADGSAGQATQVADDAGEFSGRDARASAYGHTRAMRALPLPTLHDVYSRRTAPRSVCSCPVVAPPILRARAEERRPA